MVIIPRRTRKDDGWMMPVVAHYHSFVIFFNFAGARRIATGTDGLVMT